MAEGGADWERRVSRWPTLWPPTTQSAWRPIVKGGAPGAASRAKPTMEERAWGTIVLATLVARERDTWGTDVGEEACDRRGGAQAAPMAKEITT